LGGVAQPWRVPAAEKRLEASSQPKAFGEAADLIPGAKGVP
jgi:hypothetical protein